MIFARSRSPASRDVTRRERPFRTRCYIGGVTRCPNCAANLDGAYCSACGQPRIAPGDLSARRFFHELTDEVATLHLKFKMIRSLRALVTPGLLTTEYLAGRRRRHLSPIQLYLVCAALFFLTAPLAGFTLASSAVLLVLTLAINFLADAGATRLTVGIV
jgi:hypothetical protein